MKKQIHPNEISFTIPLMNITVIKSRSYVTKTFMALSPVTHARSCGQWDSLVSFIYAGDDQQAG
jgi:hypothetical protein